VILGSSHHFPPSFPPIILTTPLDPQPRTKDDDEEEEYEKDDDDDNDDDENETDTEESAPLRVSSTAKPRSPPRNSQPNVNTPILHPSVTPSVRDLCAFFR
jgi:hypothetical protein